MYCFVLYLAELNLEAQEDIHSPSSNSSGDIKVNTKYSLSAPSSAKKYQGFLTFKDFVMNTGSPSPDVPDVEVVTHPENAIIDMQDTDIDNTSTDPMKESTNSITSSQLFLNNKNHIYQNLMMESMSKEEENDLVQQLSASRSGADMNLTPNPPINGHRDMKSEPNNIAAGDIAKALVNDVIESVLINTTNSSRKSIDNSNMPHMTPLIDTDEDDQRENIEDAPQQTVNTHKSASIMNKMESDETQQGLFTSCRKRNWKSITTITQ